MNVAVFPLVQWKAKSHTAAECLGDLHASVTPGQDSDRPKVAQAQYLEKATCV